MHIKVREIIMIAMKPIILLESWIFFEYQFLLNRYKIIPARPEAHTDNAVVITNMVLDHMKDYEMIYLSDHEYVYLKGPVLESYQQLQ